MSNQTASIPFPDGAIATIHLPAFVVGYKTLAEDEQCVIVLCRTQRKSDESPYAALAEAETEHPGGWVPTSGIENGDIETGAPGKYWQVALRRESDTVVRLEIPDQDPIRDSYRRISDREPIDGLGFDDIKKVISDGKALLASVAKAETRKK